MAVRVKGLEKVIANLNAEVQKIEERTLKGLLRGGLLILRDVETTPPKVPVDLGNLRNSRFLVTSKGGRPVAGGSFSGEHAGKLSSGHGVTVYSAAAIAQASRRPMVILGFSAYYAVYVHEMLGANFNRPGSGAKFFEAAIKRNSRNILLYISEENKKK